MDPMYKIKCVYGCHDEGGVDVCGDGKHQYPEKRKLFKRKENMTNTLKERLDFLTKQLSELIGSEDMEDEDLRNAAEGLLPNLSDALHEAGFDVQEELPLLVYYGPHPCQKCDPDGKKGTMIVKAGNGAPDDLEFNFVHDSQYPNHVWKKHNHLTE